MRSTYGDKGEKMRSNDMVHVAGGTGWVVQMVIDHNREHPEDWKQLMVFDLADERWVELFPSEGNDGDISPESPAIAPLLFWPIERTNVHLMPHSAVVGTHKMPDVGRRVMRVLFNETGGEVYRTRKNLYSLYDEWVAKMLHDNSGMWRKENSAPKPPKWHPEPPKDLDDGNPFPWMFVKGIGFVRRRPFTDRWEDRDFKPGGTGEWDMFYTDPKVDADEVGELRNAVSFWQQHVETESECRLSKEQEKDQTKDLPEGVVDRMCHDCGPPFRGCVCLNIEDMEEEVDLSSKLTCSVV